jgi:hypothetical protein
MPTPRGLTRQADSECARARLRWPLLANMPPRLVIIPQNHRMAVKRTQDRVESYQLGHVKLYRDDLEQITKAVMEVGDLRVACGAWELTDPGDFSDPELPERLPDLRMTAHPPGSKAGIEVVLGRWQAHVTLTEPDTRTLGVLSRIQQVCKVRNRGLRRPTSLAMVVVPGLITFGLARFSPPLSNSLTALFIAGWIVLYTFVGDFLLGRTRWGGDESAFLINAYRTERPDFWQRTRDDWVVGAVWALIGGVIGYFVNQIT